ncbi:MAG TPA: LptF/LptG family permease [Methylovirgula sp.]|nr:LptF/LptG family permease [Methylovirgula sp.]
MPRLLYLYLARRIFLAVLVLETGLCVPVVMTSLFHYLPTSAVRSGLLWPALLGTLPTVVYIALPMAVGVAVALEFSRMAADGMIAVLYSLRLSVLSICLPAAVVASIAVGFGYWISCFVAPAYVGQMHDVIHVIRNSLNHRLLEPAQFYTFDNGTRTLYFQRWKSPDVVSNMFIHQFDTAKNEEDIITAETTEFRRNEHGVLLVMSNGSVQRRPIGSNKMSTSDFGEYVLQIDMQGTNGLPKRNWTGVFELQLPSFLQAAPGHGPQHYPVTEWTSEAAKRFGIPILALAHALLAMALVLTLANATGRNASTISALVLVPAVHIGILIGTESLVRRDPRLVVLVALAIAAEFAAALVLLVRQQANFAVPRPVALAAPRSPEPLRADLT